MWRFIFNNIVFEVEKTELQRFVNGKYNWEDFKVEDYAEVYVNRFARKLFEWNDENGMTNADVFSIEVRVQKVLGISGDL